MQDTIFRQYDIRGIVGSELDLEQVYDLGRAIALYLVQEKRSVKRVALGMDGRVHSLAIKERLSQALCDSGLDVVFIGVCPSPVLYFAVFTQPVDAGLMITASHNPKEYNGIKICLGKESVWGPQIKTICELFKARKHITTARRGTESSLLLVPTYINWLVDHFSNLKNMTLSAVIDCGNGAAGTVMPALIQAMGWKNVQLLYPEVDGTYPNHEADPVNEENMQTVKDLLLTTPVTVGLGLDGDCDRMAPMTKSGYLVPGDKLLAIFSKQVLAHWAGASIVFDIKSSSGLHEVIKQHGGSPCISPSGHSIIKDQMKKSNALLGGELSCHFFFNDRYFGYDDGIYAALRLFEILTQQSQTLDELIADFPHTFSSPEIRVTCAEQSKQSVIKTVHGSFAQRTDVEISTIDGIRVSTPYGWGLLRASNTQAVLCLRFESDTHEGLCHLKKDFFEIMSNHFDEQLLAELK